MSVISKEQNLLREPRSASIAVIGGGFTGVAFVIHAIRSLRAMTQPVHLDIAIVEPGPELGRGIAYGTRDPLHRINVPSDRMSLFAGDPAHATRWLREQGAIDPGSNDGQGNFYVSRSRYGDYLAATLNEIIAQTTGNVHVTHRQARAVDVHKTADGCTINLDDGTTLAAQHLALCFGHTPAAPPGTISAAASADPRLVVDPWAANALDAVLPHAPVLLIGTGLTMADVAATLIERGHRGPITAISRRALRARSHGIFIDKADFLGATPPPDTARQLVRMLRQRIANESAQMGWQPAADALRFDLPRIWNALPPREQRRVVKRLLAFWDVHRFRIAPQINATIDRAISLGQMSILKAGVTDVNHAAEGFSVGIRRAGGQREVLACEAVIYCTGPERDIDRNPLVRALLAKGLATVDASRTGIRTDLRSRVIDADGAVSRTLWAFGPMTRGTFGEMTGAPDIARHLERLLTPGTWLDPDA